MSNILANKRGAALAIVLMVLVTLGTLGMAISLGSINESRLARRQLYSTQSFWLAEAGIQKAVWEINFNSCHGLTNRTTGAACVSCSSCGGGEKSASGALGSGEYDAVVDAAGTTVTSTGYYPAKTSAQIQRAVQVILGGSPLFGYAAFSTGTILVSNNASIDSYNSDNGVYGGANRGSEGNIGTNSGTANVIAVQNNAIVKGDVSTGPGGTVSLGNNAVVTGEITHENNVSLPDVVVPDELTSATYGGTYSVPLNGTQTLSAGDYKYGSITMGNNAKLYIDGDVKLYLTAATGLDISNNCQVIVKAGASLEIYTDGRISVRNNASLNNLTNKPENLIIYSTYSQANGIDIENNAAMQAAIYAPGTNINLENNAGFYGAVVGGTVTLSNNADLHYDAALGDITSGASGQPRNWQEI